MAEQHLDLLQFSSDRPAQFRGSSFEEIVLGCLASRMCAADCQMFARPTNRSKSLSSGLTDVIN
jgi:hypothetical protein